MQGIKSDKLSATTQEQKTAPQNNAPPSAQMLDLLIGSAPMVERRDHKLIGPTDSDGSRQTCLKRLTLIGVPIGVSAFGWNSDRAVIAP